MDFKCVKFEIYIGHPNEDTNTTFTVYSVYVSFWVRENSNLILYI